MRRTLALALAFVFATVGASASADDLPIGLRQTLDQAVRNRAKTVPRTDPESTPALLQDLTNSSAVAAYLFEDALATHPDRVDLATLRDDIQLGALTGRTASTSIVARPSISEIFSAAFESGAITRKSDDTSTTFNVNALMVRQLLSGDMPRGCATEADDCRQGPGRWLRGLSGSATFSMAGSTVVPEGTDGIALLDNRALTALGVRYELFVRERRNQQLEDGLKAAAPKLAEAATAFAGATLPLQELIDRVAATWRADVESALALELSRPGDDAAVLKRAEGVLLERYRDLRRRLEDAPEFARLNAAAVAAQRDYVRLQNRVLAENLYRKALTVDYLHERPSTQPELHQLRLVFSTPLGRKPATADAEVPAPAAPVAAPSGALTLNAGVSFFRPELTPPEGWKVRDTQLSAALDWTPVRTGSLRPTYTVAYYFQYMVANGVIQFDKTAITPGGAAIPLPKAASEVLDTKGAIHVAQVRVSIPAARGVTFPLAVSYSNRSELITGKSFWQGHAGISYDLSQLKSLLPRR